MFLNSNLCFRSEIACFWTLLCAFNNYCVSKHLSLFFVFFLHSLFRSIAYFMQFFLNPHVLSIYLSFSILFSFNFRYTNWFINMILLKKKLFIKLVMLTAFFQIFYYNISLNASVPVSRSKAGCNAISPQTQPSVLIDGVRYPKHAPWHHNNSINFSCLNENRVIGKKRILLWTTFHANSIRVH